jgi:hypothetical protein
LRLSASRIEIYQLRCGSHWGWFLIGFLALGAAGYVGGGVAYNVKVKGAAPGPGALPHPGFWRELRALVEDGAKFAVAEAKRRAGGGGGGAEQLLDREGGEDGMAATPAKAVGVAAAAAGPAAIVGGSDSDSDDSLVE